MKLSLLIPLIIMSFSLHAQETTSYDAKLAGQLGADEYGMKAYVLVILKEGSETDIDEARMSELFRGHQDNMQRWEEENKLIVAGPFFPNDAGMEGIFILDISFEEAQSVLQSDPAIQAGALTYEAYRWYGSAALPLYIDSHYKVQKIKP